MRGEDAEVLRREILHGLTAANLDASVVSKKMGRSKDYIGDFLRGKKKSLGHKEIVAIRAFVEARTNVQDFQNAPESKEQKRCSESIRVGMSDFRSAAFATLRTSGVPAVLAKSRVDDLVEDLKALSVSADALVSEELLHIELGSEDREDDVPTEQQSDV